MSDGAGGGKCYEQEGSAAQCSAGTTASMGKVNGGTVTICTPAGCPAPGAWRP